MLTDTQRTTLAAAIRADASPEVVAALAGRNDTELVRLYNLPSTFVIWKKNTSKQDIFGAIAWKNLTPADAPDGTAAYTNRALACQSRQFNIQTMLISPGESLDMTKANIRTGVKDAVEGVPSGAGGALLDAGWTAIKAASTRLATVAETLFATGTGTNGSPGALTVEGSIDTEDVGRALNDNP